MIGRTIGSYRVESLLGSGGMGAVYRGLDLMLERPVAIKVLRSDVATQPHVVERFKQEARTVARLLHPNIATLYALVPDGDDLCMVMEFCEGETFETLLARRGRLDPAEVLPLFGQALDGIGHAHARGIVHRDIKPANLIRSPAGTVKVMDFGIARLLGSSRMTQTRHTVGTAEYMAPEQVRAQEVDGRSDVYALGVLLYELLTGRVPFQSDSFFEVMQAHLTAEPPPPRQFAPTLPEPLVDVVLRAMAKLPENRFASASDLHDALDAAVRPTLETPTPARATIVAPVPEEREHVRAREPENTTREHEVAGAREDAATTVGGDTAVGDEPAGGAHPPPAAHRSAQGRPTVPLDEGDSQPSRERSDPPAGGGVRPDADAPADSKSAPPAPTRRARKTRIASRRSSGSTAALPPPAGPTAFAPTPAGPTALAPTPEAEPPTVPFPTRAPATRTVVPDRTAEAPDARPAWWTKTATRTGLGVAAALLLAVGVWSTTSGPEADPSATTAEAADASSRPRPAGGGLASPGDGTAPLGPLDLPAPGTAPVADAPAGAGAPPPATPSAPGAAPIAAAPAPGRDAPATRPAERLPDRPAARPADRPIREAPAEPIRSQVAATGAVRVLVRPFGDVYVDGQRQASGTNAPVTTEVSPGLHTIRVTHPVFGTQERSVRVEAGRTESVSIEFATPASVTVTSDPVNAQIYLDGQATGRYTPATVQVPPGRHTIEVRRDGFQPASQSVTIDGGRSPGPLRFSLTPN